MNNFTHKEKMEILAAAILNCPHAIEFFLQILDIEPCKKCGFIVTKCKCWKKE